ncbi:tetratricopeptide (TPR) repeat protein [Sporomusaceae bacterium BoRhaA]|uniref:glycosyltransferase n=1 Tax=Pelorhabdus rhamnosifermentans TaxID=2772457 RepID=UPI001C0644CD|nr:glycosyltransferase [Pelorhabdus rhamnosifermentans]MBU2700874.1 tetratricopeptide (TPR) repeat protein [Pelorhabdus rhamnosifermentans]
MITTISLAMIVRDAEADLALCLNSILTEVDEIVIVDTGSKDGTFNIAKSFTNKTYSYEWSGDFSAARNFAISKCTGQWIFSLDADEKLDSKFGSLRQLITDTPEAEAFLLPLLVCVGATDERFSVVRLFRNTAEYCFAGKIHEQVVITKSNVVAMGDAPVIRHKLVTGKERNKKRRRNLEMLRQAVACEPDNAYLKYYLGVEWLGFRRFEQALTCFQEAVAIIRPDCLMFRGPAVRYLVDCLKFLGRLDDALAVCHNECEINPVYTDVFFDAGAILAEQGKFKQAIGYFHKAIELGVPPLVLYHSQGTESFFAFYQMGFCYEKIGCHELAEHYYWQALAANPYYICPLYSLFLLKVTHLPATDVYDYFKDKQSFVFDPWVETLATVFFDMGFPDLAAACYKQSPAFAATSVMRIKSLLYSGSVKEALQILSSDENEKKSLDIVTEEIIAHIINGDYHTAKQRALKLWADSPLQRSKAWALLAIIARCSSTGGYSKPEKSRELEVVQTCLSILENCLRFNPKDPDMLSVGPVFQKLVTILVTMLTELSAYSNLCLVNLFRRKAGKVRSLLDYKYASARGLYV